MFNSHQRRKALKHFHICIFFFNVLLLSLHQIQKTSLGVSNTASMGGTVNLTSFSLLTAVISLSQFFFPLIESRENTIVEFFFCYLNKWEYKKYICGTLSFTALQVNPTMTTSTAEKTRNVKKVHREM